MRQPTRAQLSAAGRALRNSRTCEENERRAAHTLRAGRTK